MNFYCTLFFVFITSISNGQIKLFKDINKLEEGSYPSNFVEANGIVFFLTLKFDGYFLWKTDGTELGTLQVSEQRVILKSNDNLNNLNQNLIVFNSEVYYLVFNPITLQNDLWKTNGLSINLVFGGFSAKQLIVFDNDLYAVNISSIDKVVGNSLQNVMSFPNQVIRESCDNFQGKLIVHTTEDSGNGNSVLRIWKYSGSVMELISIFEGIINIYQGNWNYERKMIVADTQIFFIIFKLVFENSRFSYFTELWKSDGNTIGTFKIKEIEGLNYYNAASLLKNLKAFNGNLLFNDGISQWISDGTSQNTIKLKSFQLLFDGKYNEPYGILNNKFIFSAKENEDSELWISDGTPAGTILLKNLKQNGSSNPNHFVSIANKVYFRANNNSDLWETNGTESGTVFIRNIPKASGSIISNNINYDFALTTSGSLYFSNYDNLNNSELWISNLGGTRMLKNLATGNMGSRANESSVKVGNVWYFSVFGELGHELWKSDGTENGTIRVKDISMETLKNTITEMVATSDKVYFTTTSSFDFSKRLWKSDGTEAGTTIISFSSQYLLVPNVNPEMLTSVGNKIFFKGVSNQGFLWFSDGTNENTRPLNNSNLNSNLSNLTQVNGKLAFTIEGLWISDGTEVGTYAVTSGFYETPLNPISLLEFKNHVYFFSSYFLLNATGGSALWESDGTSQGTKIVKEFNESNDYLTSSSLLFLERSENKMYFRVKPTINSFDLWSSDGTASGTGKIKNIPLNNGRNQLRFGSKDSTFYMFNYSYIGNNITGYSSGGYANNTQIFIQKTMRNNGVSKIGVFNNKIFFGIDDDNYGHELWTSDGTLNGTQLVGEVRHGIKSSYVFGLMDFYDKLLFWGYDDLVGNELRYYSESTCNNNINYSIKSGSWQDSTTWSCGRVPLNIDNVVIKSGHNVLLLANQRAKAKRFRTEEGGVFEAQANSVLDVTP